MAKPLWDKIDMPSKLDAIEGWMLQGATEEEVYKKLRVSKTTWHRWKKEHLELLKPLKRGREIAEGELVGATFKAAKGYSYEEEHKFVRETTNKDGEKISTTTLRTVTKQVQPNSTLLIWLTKNWLGWTDKVNVKVDELDIHITIDDDEFNLEDEETPDNAADNK